MLSIGLCSWYINITITILDIIHRPVSGNKRLALSSGPIWFEFHLKAQTVTSLRNVVLKLKTGQWMLCRVEVVITEHQLGDEPILRCSQSMSYSKISQHFMESKFHYRSDYNPQLVPILGQINSVDIFSSSISYIHFNIFRPTST
jgi:hypothetical protein